MDIKKSGRALSEAYVTPHLPTEDELAAARQLISEVVSEAAGEGVPAIEILEKLTAVLDKSVDTAEAYTRYLAQQAGLTPTDPASYKSV